MKTLLALLIVLAVGCVSSLETAKALPSFPCSPTQEQKWVFFNVTKYDMNYTSNRLAFEFTNTYINYTTRCVGYRNPDGFTEWQPCENQAVPTYFMRRDNFNAHEDLIINQTWVCSDNPASNPNNLGPPRTVTAIGQTNIDMCRPLVNPDNIYHLCYPSGESFGTRLQHKAPPPPLCPSVGSTTTWNIPSITLESRKRMPGGFPDPWSLPPPPHIDLTIFEVTNPFNGWTARCFGSAKARADEWFPARGDPWQTCPTFDETVDQRAFPERTFKYDHFGTGMLELNETAKCVDEKGERYSVSSYGTATLGQGLLKCSKPDPGDAEEKFTCGPVVLEMKGVVTAVVPATWQPWS